MEVLIIMDANLRIIFTAEEEKKYNTQLNLVKDSILFQNKNLWLNNSCADISYETILTPDNEQVGISTVTTGRESGGDFGQKIDFAQYIGKKILLNVMLIKLKNYSSIPQIGIDWYGHNALILGGLTELLSEDKWLRLSTEWTVPNMIIGNDIRIIVRQPFNSKIKLAKFGAYPEN
jgi:hypothetical protein